MSSNTTFEIIYLKKKYFELGIINKDIGWFNANIYPEEKYILICTECKNDFESFKKNKVTTNMEVEWNHSISCLWYDYFISKVKQLCKSAKIVKKNNKITSLSSSVKKLKL